MARLETSAPWLGSDIAYSRLDVRLARYRPVTMRQVLALRADHLPAALIQAQRDLFGAHTYRRTDREGVFHTRWAGDHSEEQTA